jgi:hypothetical protein
VAGGATLGGRGVISGNVEVQGTVSPGASVGKLTVGSLNFSATTAAVAIEIMGDTLGANVPGIHYDQLASIGDVTGLSNANLTVTFDLASGVDPRKGRELGGATGLTLLTSGASLDGQTFRSVTLTDTYNNGVHLIHPWRATIATGMTGTTGYVKVTNIDFVAIGGDANLDGKINLADLGILAGNYNQSNTTWFQGDFNFNGVVNLADLGILAGHYNTTYNNNLPLDGGSVPEPISMLLLGIGGAALLRRRK